MKICYCYLEKKQTDIWNIIIKPIKKYYQDFIEGYEKAHPSLNKHEYQSRYNKEWVRLKPDLVNGNESDFKRVRLTEAPEALWF